MSVTIKSAFDSITAQMLAGLEKQVAKSTFNIEAGIKESFTGPKSGRVYGSHVASAPGEAPAIDTGAYANSFQSAAQGLEGEVGTNSEYGAALELGTAKTGSRKHIEPAVEDERENFNSGCKAAMGQVKGL